MHEGEKHFFQEMKALLSELSVHSRSRLLPLGRKARRTLSGRRGGATRPPATLSCKADPANYPARLSLRYSWQQTKFRTNRKHIYGWQVGPYNVIFGGFFYWPESGFLSKIGAHA